MSDKWIKCSDKLPEQEVKIILFANSVVQNETFELYKGMNGDYFWAHQEINDWPVVNFQHDMWQPLPDPPK